MNKLDDNEDEFDLGVFSTQFVRVWLKYSYVGDYAVGRLWFVLYFELDYFFVSVFELILKNNLYYFYN